MDEIKPNPSPEDSTSFTSMGDFRHHLSAALAQAEGSVLWFDRDLAETGINQPQNIENLQRMLGGKRPVSIRLLLHEGDFLCRKCPKLLRLLDIYGNSISVRLTNASHRNVNECFLLTDELVVRRYHNEQPRGEASRAARAVTLCLQRFEALWLEASPFTDWRRLHI